MSLPVIDYLKALTLCLVAAIGYRWTVLPLVEPPTGNLVEVDGGMQELTNPDLGHIFAADAWQMNNPKVLRAEWGWLLFQNWEQDAPDRWRVSPVSIVMESDAAGENLNPRAPVLLDAPAGAVIEFAEPLNMITGAAPAIKGGQLLGEVHIFTQKRQPDSNYQVARAFDDESFDLVTSNVRIDNRQIRSAEEVRLQVGQAKLSGRDLTIKLAAGGNVPTTADGPLSVLDSLELIYLDELVIPLADGPLWQPMNPQSGGAHLPESPQRQITQDTRCTVECDGRVVFDFTTFVLKLSQRVEFKHFWATDLYDSFECRSLDIHLVDPFVSTKQKGPNPTDPLARVRQRLKRIVARGAPVQADVPSANSRLTADEIVIDAEKGEFRMASNDSRDGGRIDLQYGDFHIAIPRMTYRINPTAPDRLGTLISEGSGTVSISDPSNPLRSVTWNQTLQILPQDVGYLAWVAGAVKAQLRDGGTADADDILLAFDLVPARPASENIVSATPARDEFVVDKFRARGNVSLDTSQLAAKTDTLLLLFEHLADQSEDVGGGAIGGTAGPKLNPASGPRQKFWLQSPDEAAGASNVSTAVAPIARPRPTLAGDAITANLMIAGGEIVAQDLSVVKNVRLDHELQTANGVVPLVYTGDSLRLITGSGDDRIQITGEPARIDLGSGFFEGPLVVVSGKQNEVSIRDRGTFQVPIAVLPRGQGDSVRWLNPPRCDFTGELTFDGRLVEITDDVKLSGRVIVGQQQETWDIQAKAPRLEIVLDRDVNVTKPTDAREAAVDRISLVGDQTDVLLVATQLDPRFQPLGRHVLNNPRLDFYAATGDLRGQGPGWYRSWTPSTEDSPLRSIAPPGSLLATHLIYNGGLDGNLANKEIGFQRGVRVGFSAVDRWDQMIDAATMTQLALNQGTVDCDRLQLGVAATGQTNPSENLPWEIQALGGVAFRMMTQRGMVDGTAARAAFDAGNDLFVLEGTPQRYAVVRNATLTGQPRFNVEMQSFTLRPATLEINTLVREATVSQLPGNRP
jgi:hypothetical protein